MFERHRANDSQGEWACQSPDGPARLFCPSEIGYKDDIVRCCRLVQPSHPPNPGPLRGVLVAAALLLLVANGCQYFSKRSGVPTNYNLPLTVQLRMDSSITQATLDYRNACGQPTTLPIHPQLEQAIEKRMGRVFERVTSGEARGTPDGTVDAALGLKQLDVFVPRKGNKAYPATVTLGTDFSYTDQQGNILYSKKLQAIVTGEVEAKADSCDIGGLAPVAQEAIEKLAEGMAEQVGTAPKVREVAQLKKGGSSPVVRPITQVTEPTAVASAAVGAPTPPVPPQTAVPPIEPPPVHGATASEATAPPSVPSAETPSGPTKLSFRTILRDENRSQVLEADEAFTIEFEIKNEGGAAASGVEIVLAGHAAIVGGLKNPVAVGTLQPGEVRRVSVDGKLGPVSGLEQGELVCTLRASAGVELPSAKKFLVAISPDRGEDVEVLSVDVDQVPKQAGKLKQPNAVGIAIGVGGFRDPSMPAVKFAAHDAEVVGHYFRSILGIPDARVRVVTDTHALKDDLVEVFERWLPKQSGPPAVAYVYISGRAVVDAESGAVSVVPYDGTLASTGRTFSLARVRRALAHASIKKAVLLLDLSLEPSPGADATRPISPVWEQADSAAESDEMMWMVGNSSLQEAHAYQQGQHGLFTYFLLKGLRGAGDLDKNGTVLAGELCTYVHGQVEAVAHTQFGNSQTPLCLPRAGQLSPIRAVPLSKLR